MEKRGTPTPTGFDVVGTMAGGRVELGQAQAPFIWVSKGEHRKESML